MVPVTEPMSNGKAKCNGAQCEPETLGDSVLTLPTGETIKLPTLKVRQIEWNVSFRGR